MIKVRTFLWRTWKQTRLMALASVYLYFYWMLCFQYTIQRLPLKMSAIRKQKNNSSTARSFDINADIAFYFFAGANLFSACYAPILDCDEVYNYWEPTHYLTHGYGLQTWEYSPEYSIRSWLYVSLHAVVGAISSLFSKNKVVQFYCIRSALAIACAICQARLYSSISKFHSPRVALIFLVIACTTPGFFSASTAYLPSSFAMYCNMLAMASLMRSGQRAGRMFDSGIAWFGTGGILGWPFSAALCLPFLAESTIWSLVVGDLPSLVRDLSFGAVKCWFVLVAQAVVEWFFYRKFVLVPWNIVKYNVFSGPGKGPNIFGTEPADFYIRNLLLNFHVWFILALLAGPFLAMQLIDPSKGLSKVDWFAKVVFTSPLYMWLAIFSSQAHKEERFMYPVYPFLALNAAVSLHLFLAWAGGSNPASIPGKIPARIKLAIMGPALLMVVQLGLLRTIGMIDAYRAPLQVYDFNTVVPAMTSSDTVCVGKEWFRFPSSFFLPNGVHAKFIQSEFDGLLPGEFKEARTGFGFFPGTWMIPANMNDQNIPDRSKLTNVRHCSYLVDFSIAGSNGTTLEPNYAADEATWERLSCKKFLDTDRTSLLGRVIYVPQLPLLPRSLQRQWGEYCVLRRKASSIS